MNKIERIREVLTQIASINGKLQDTENALAAEHLELRVSCAMPAASITIPDANPRLLLEAYFKRLLEQRQQLEDKLSIKEEEDV